MAAALVLADDGSLLANGDSLVYSESGDPVECCCPERCCACESDLALVMVLSSPDTECACLDGLEIPLTASCADGLITSFTSDDPEPDYPCEDPSSFFLFAEGFCSPDALPGEFWQVSILLSNNLGLPQCGLGTVSGNVIIHSCTPFHISGSFVLDPSLTGCGDWCEGVSPPNTYTIEFDIVVA